MLSHKTLPSLYCRVSVLAAALVLTFATLLVPGTASAAGQGALKKLDRALNAARAKGTTTALSVIVRTTPGQRAAVRDRLKAQGGVLESEHPSLDAFTMRVLPSQFDAMSIDPAVNSVSINSSVSSFGAPGGGGASGTNVLRDTLGLTAASPTGKGIGVAIIDSGITPSADFDGKILGFYDFVKLGGALTMAYDDYGHGTHIAGLVGSTGANGSQDKGVAQIGRAHV